MKTIYTIIHGEPATGKTLNKSSIKEEYGFDHVLDEYFDNFQIRKARGKVAILTNNKKPRPPIGMSKLFVGAKKLSIQEVKERLGKKWAEPNLA